VLIAILTGLHIGWVYILQKSLEPVSCDHYINTLSLTKYNRHLKEHCKDTSPTPNLEFLNTFKDWQLITPINIALMISPICLICPLQLVNNALGRALLLRVTIFHQHHIYYAYIFNRFSKTWVTQAILMSSLTLKVKYG